VAVIRAAEQELEQAAAAQLYSAAAGFTKMRKVMKQIKYFIYSVLMMLAAVAIAIACDSKGELTNSVYQLKKGECHEFSLKTDSESYVQLTAQQNGVDVEMRLFENGVEIKSTDSENLNSGFEFLPFISKMNSNYKLQINWVDDRNTFIKNEGFYKLEQETRIANDQDKSFVNKFETAKSLYDRSTVERVAKNQNSAANYLSAIAIYKSLPETKSTKYKLFLSNYYLGVFYNTSKKYDEAVNILETSKTLAVEAQDRYLENLTLTELGIAYYKVGNLTRSNEVLESAVAGFEKLSAEKIGETKTLPYAYIAQAETLFRLNRAEQAIKILENVRVNYKNSVSENLLAAIKLADVYFDLGDTRRAEEIISSLVIPENSNDYDIKGLFNKISGKLVMKTDKTKALDFFNKANSFFVGNDHEKAETSMFIGNTYYYAKNYATAKNYYDQAKTSFELQNDQLNLAQIFNNLGVISYYQKDYPTAILSCENALAINITMQNGLNEARNQINLMYFNEATGNQLSAIFYGKWAINTLQAIKYQQLQSLEKEIQDNFQESFNDAFRKLANLLIKDGRISEAEQVLRFIKEKEYQDYVRGEGKLTGIDFTKREVELLKEAKVKKEKKSLPPTEIVIDDDAPALSDKSPVKQLINDLRSQGVDVSEFVFINTLVTKDAVSIIATNSTKQKVYTQNLSRENLNNLVFEFRDSVTTIIKNPKIDGKKLYDILIKPVENDFLSSKVKKIVWSLDGVLRYIPISALFDGKNYLVQRFAEIQLNIADDKKVLMVKSTEQPAIGMASSKSFEGLSGLPIAKNELDCIFEDEKKLIINSTCKKGIIKGKKVADDDFTKAVFEDALKQYKLIHLTSHFVLQTGDNSKSYLLLGGGKERKYTMQTFSAQKLNNVEVLIMSACNTANFSPDGSEFESFAMMAQKQGAKSVIGTLWSVADVSTSVFMTEFYRFYNNDKLDKAEAIRQAQIVVSKNKKYSHPFYWSPFVLFGNWK
jgi:CHAT domain-containing protein